MDKTTFDRFREVVYEKSGIRLSEAKEALVTARVGKRMRTLGIPTHGEYLKYVLADETEQEMVQFIDAISTNVTSFFRESKHFDLTREVVAEWIAGGQQRFRFWSAASSTGEEPYSLAMTLLDAANGKPLDMKILATDISTRVLQACQAGVYSQEKVDTVPARLRDRYLQQQRGNGQVAYAVRECLKDMISFRRLNLSVTPFPMRGPLDIVFCRNVMIYFDNAVRSALLQEISRLLKPGGYLMVGHAESLTGMVCDLKTVQPSVYMKPLR